MRPKSVVLAEWLYLASIGLLIAVSVLTPNSFMEAPSNQGVRCGCS